MNTEVPHGLSPYDKFRDDTAMKFFGRSLTLAQAINQCVSCGKSAGIFKDERYKREYQISGLCDACQDEVFKDFDEPEA